VERLVMLWDELDELVGIGRHWATTVTLSMAGRVRRTSRLLRGLAVDQA
jgi:hypothetical protein